MGKSSPFRIIRRTPTAWRSAKTRTPARRQRKRSSVREQNVSPSPVRSTNTSYDTTSTAELRACSSPNATPATSLTSVTDQVVEGRYRGLGGSLSGHQDDLAQGGPAGGLGRSPWISSCGG